jgi:hypothetical protein
LICVTSQYAINTGVDYGIENLEALKGFGFMIDGVTDGDKANRSV